jgi:hypothetical protein
MGEYFGVDCGSQVQYSAATVLPARRESIRPLQCDAWMQGGGIRATRRVSRMIRFSALRACNAFTLHTAWLPVSLAIRLKLVMATPGQDSDRAI